MTKVAFIGAGSYIFTMNLVRDLLSFEALADSTISLMDIDEDRLDLVYTLTTKMVRERGAAAKVERTTDRRKALDGADYVLVTVEIGGLDVYRYDLSIPDKYGINQNVGDTLGPGGVFRAMRTAPVMVGIAKDMEELCPNALMLNYTNPMAILCWIINRTSSINVVGLCHSVQHTAQQLASYAEVPYEKLEYFVAGINHMAWFLRLTHKGKDLYPVLRREWKHPEKLWEKVIEPYKQFGMIDAVRFKVMEHFDYFVTESPYHMSEYLPYFRKDEKAIKDLGVDRRWWLGFKESPDQFRNQIEDYIEGKKSLPAEDHSDEYATYIINSMETGEQCRINGNVMNTGLIPNLPENCCVEVPCTIDKTGVHPWYVGELPPQLAALNRSNIAVQESAVNAFVNRDKRALYHAIYLDPFTSSKLTLDQIQAMVDELVEAEKEHLPF